MVHRLVVSYGQPADPAAFDAYYRETHTPLALKQPGLVRLTFGHAASLDPSQPAPYLVAELDFDSEQAMGESLVVAGGPGGRQGPRQLRDRRRHVHALRGPDGEARGAVNGAQALIRTLVDAGVDVCFANPGTSEMHFVAALDDVPEMRAVLTLFEGVATGAADGYARMAGRPAATLLHLGPGMGNGLANLHNARRGRTPMVNVVGDHARSHKRLDAPLESDIDARRRHGLRLGAPVAVPGRRRGATRPRRSRPRRRADRSPRWSCPADVSWEDGAESADPLPVRPGPAGRAVRDRGRRRRRWPPASPTVLFLGGDVDGGEEGQLAAARRSPPARAPG